MIALSALYFAQQGECFYCGELTWIPTSGEGRNTIRSELMATGMMLAKLRVALHQRAASREHLKRKADGGGSSRSNLVMACVGCNGLRHNRPVLVHLGNMRNAAALRRAGGSV